MVWNARRSVVHSCSLFPPPDDSCRASALKKCSIASWCAPIFKPGTIRMCKNNQGRDVIELLTSYADVIDSAGVRGPELQGFAVRAQRLLGLIAIRQTRAKPVPQQVILHTHTETQKSATIERYG